MKRDRARIFLAIICSACLVLLLLLLNLFQVAHRDYRAAQASVSPLPAKSLPAFSFHAGSGRSASDGAHDSAPTPFEFSGEKPGVEIRSTLHRGESLSDALARHGLAGRLINQIVDGFRGTIDFRKLKPGETISVQLTPSGRLAGCTYSRSPLESYTLIKSVFGWRAEKNAIPLICRTVRVCGKVGPGMLSDAFIAAGERPKLAAAFSEIFASRIDFNTEIAEDDQFDLLVQEYYKKDRFVGYGKILVGRFLAAGATPLEAVYYEFGETRGYFSLDGKSLGTFFIRSPVPLARVSSGYSDRRLHPILGIVRPHLGIDLAAPIGTPVMAAANGRVQFIGINGGFGKQIVLDHAGGYRTYYGHLSRFRTGLQVGDRVRQRDIIGYVGATGLATGPHLDYRLEHLGEFKNPFTVKFPSQKELAGENLARLRLNAEIYATLMKGAAPSQIVAIKKLTPSADSPLASL
jgi:murein DD-endopeptidase MepM/ murein hydrolase activator NlpD